MFREKFYICWMSGDMPATRQARLDVQTTNAFEEDETEQGLARHDPLLLRDPVHRQGAARHELGSIAS